MTSSDGEQTEEPTTGIGDEKLPEDLVPGDDNPLAEALPDGERVGDLLEDGKAATESDDPDDSDDSQEA
ncbi:hypothetical protein BH09ACT12_BH09ACT12_08520 [soil metagenome]